MWIDTSVWFNTTLDFVRATSGTLEHGVYKAESETIASVIGDLQPNQKEQTYAEYGFVTDAEYRFFCEDSAPMIGDTTVIDDVTYEVDKTVDWDDYKILYLKAVQNA